jgi:hypothetical protein
VSQIEWIRLLKNGLPLHMCCDGRPRLQPKPDTKK